MQNLIIAIIAILFHWSGPDNLKVRVKNINKSEGQVRIALYNSNKSFMKEKEIYTAKAVAATKDETILVIENIPDGTYAISVFHDVNNDEVLNNSPMGWPSEGFGFSNNPDIKLGPPSFKKAAFDKKGSTEVTIEMYYFMQ